MFYFHENYIMLKSLGVMYTEENELLIITSTHLNDMIF